MAAAVELQKEPSVPIPEDTESVKYSKALVAKALVGVVTYPLTFAKTLIQLGYEPYSLSTGRVFIVAGREAYFLPNAFKYITNIYKENGALSLYRGVEAGFSATLIGGAASYIFQQYIDQHYKEIGGDIPQATLEKKEEELEDYESFRIHFRTAIRQTFSHTVGLIIQRPLTVVMVREVAQYIGGESKYLNVFSSILRIGHEEGPGGLFSGLIPALITDYIIVWGVGALSYAVKRGLIHAERKKKDDKQALDTIQSVKKVTDLLVPFVVAGWSYSFTVCSTVMSVTGSNLVVSLLPYAPLHGHWTDAYHYLKPYGLARGARLFLREQRGPIAVGPDHQLYASNKFFV